MRTRSPLFVLSCSILLGACSSTTQPAAPVGGDRAEAEGAGQTTEAALDLARGELLPTGARVTPTAAEGSSFVGLNPDLPTRPDYLADHAVTTVLSPDGSTLLVLTSGYNLNNGPDGNVIPGESTEYVFVYDVRSGPPVKTQVLQVPNTFVGVAFNPSGKEFYVTGGVDDNVHVFARTGGQWAEWGAPIALGHTTGLGLAVKPAAAGIAVSTNGKLAVVANYSNDSVTLVDLENRKKKAELDLRPGKDDEKQRGKPGGEYPFWVEVKTDKDGNPVKAYVTSQRDAEVVMIDLTGAAPRVMKRIGVGVQPNKMLFDGEQRRLFVANGSSDTVSVIDTESDKVVDEIQVVAPRRLLPNPRGFKGANPNALALSPDEKTLYVTNGGTNSLAIVSLRGWAHDDDGDDRVAGLVPTGWYPSAVSVSADGGQLFVVNAKSISGPNPGGCRNNLLTAADASAACDAKNQYVWQLEKAGLLALPTPSPQQLARLSLQTAKNNHFPSVEWNRGNAALMRFLRRKIKHVVYVIKENRTYDQVLGDLKGADGDPKLTLFPEPISPNHHALARNFVTLDKFFDSGETSGVGWNWTTAARTTDAIEKTQPVNYAGRGLSYDWEGTNRNINVGFAALADRLAANPLTPADPDLLPGAIDVSAPAAPGGEAGTGYLWDAALRKGLSVRNYGCFGDLARYSLPTDNPAFIPPAKDPYKEGRVVFFPANARLAALSDPYFRGYDNKFPDLYRFNEWAREFDDFVKNGNLPALEFVRFPHDHFGNFTTAIDGVDTPDRQMADNDYAVGLLVDKISKSPYWRDTLVFVVEDDAQDGPDHVDSHRSVAYIVGPYVKQGAVVSTPYNTVNMVRTIEEVLGLEPLGMNDALAAPMSDVFERQPWTLGWDYDAIVPDVLRKTKLPLPPSSAQASVSSSTRRGSPRIAHDAKYWERMMRAQNFDREDALDEDQFNRALWAGIMGERTPYPTARTGID